MLRYVLHHNPQAEANAPVDDAIDLLLLKIAAVIIVFVICVVFTLLPFRLRLSYKGSFLSYANSASCGILLGFAFLHMLPNSVASYEQYVGSKASRAQVPYFVCLMGFFSVFALEKIILGQAYKRSQRDDNQQGFFVYVWEVLRNCRAG